MKTTRSGNIEKVRLILSSDPSQEFSGERTSQDSKKQLVTTQDIVDLFMLVKSR